MDCGVSYCYQEAGRQRDWMLGLPGLGQPGQALMQLQATVPRSLISVLMLLVQQHQQQQQQQHQQDWTKPLSAKCQS